MAMAATNGGALNGDKTNRGAVGRAPGIGRDPLDGPMSVTMDVTGLHGGRTVAARSTGMAGEARPGRRALPPEALGTKMVKETESEAELGKT